MGAESASSSNEAPISKHFVPFMPAVIPSEGSQIIMGSLTLDPGEEVELPVGTCQEVLVYVLSGATDAIGEGVGTAEAPAHLGPGTAALFRGETTSKLAAAKDGEQALSAVAAIARAPETPPLYLNASEEEVTSSLAAPEPSCATGSEREEQAPEPGSRVVDRSEVEQLHVAEARLTVRLLLDADTVGSRFGSMTLLEGKPDVEIPEHVHAKSAVALWIKTGKGELGVGDVGFHVDRESHVYVPKNTLHGFKGDGTDSFEAVQVFSPPGAEQRFRALAR